MLPEEHAWPLTSKRFASVLVALDSSVGGWCALDAALALCQEADAHLTVLSLEAHRSLRATVLHGYKQAEERRQSVSAVALIEAEVFASYANVHVVAHRSLPPSWKAVTAYARAHRQDLIVLGHRRGLLRGRLLPSIADQIAAEVECPVMIVRPGEGFVAAPGLAVS